MARAAPTAMTMGMATGLIMRTGMATITPTRMTGTTTDMAMPTDPDAPAGMTTTDLAPLQILTTWFSPAFPVGAYSYSHGLEWAVAEGRVRDATSLTDWTEGLLRHGAGRADAILLAHAHRADDPAPLAEMARALAPSSERLLEAVAQGAAFTRTAAAVWGTRPEPLPYPVAVGHAAGRLGLPLELTATFFVQAFAANIISAAVRLVPLGQTDGQRVTAQLLPLAAEVAADAIAAPLEEIGGLSFTADLASMAHETQTTRLYRS